MDPVTWHVQVYSLPRDDVTVSGRWQVSAYQSSKCEGHVIPCRLVGTLLSYVGFLRRVLCFVCFDVSEETTASSSR
jgi:hypothetical protein